METVEIDFMHIVVETNQAILFEFDTGRCWIPKSQIEELIKEAPDKETNKQPGRVELPEWVAIEKELV